MKASLALCLLLFSSPGFAGIQNLSLKQALDLASKQNLDLISAGQGYEQDTISYNNAWRSFFLPNISLSTQSSTALTLGSYPGTPANSTLPAGRNTGFPSQGSAITLSLGSYTLFNFFKDRITYDNAKMSFQRSGQVLEETKRSVNFRIISAYYQARLNQEKLDAAERSLQLAKTIVRLIKSRVAIGQATSTELSSVEVDANDATLQVNQIKSDFESSLYNLNALLNQNTTDRVTLTTPLSYSPLKLTYPDAFAWFKDHSPLVRGSKLSHQVAQGNLEIAEKNRMPLPTITFSGVSVSYGNRYAGGYNSYTSSGSGSAGAIEVEAAVNLTLPILGPGGLFGEDTVKSARINVNQAETRLQQTMINGELQIRASVFQLQQLEDRLKTLKLSLDSSSGLLEKIISGLSTQRANRLELRDALDRARNNEIEFLQNTYSYVLQKNQFYELIGKDWDSE